MPGAARPRPNLSTSVGCHQVRRVERKRFDVVLLVIQQVHPRGHPPFHPGRHPPTTVRAAHTAPASTSTGAAVRIGWTEQLEAAVPLTLQPFKEFNINEGIDVSASDGRHRARRRQH